MDNNTNSSSAIALMQTRFDGGLNAFGAASAIADNEYWFLRNARVRTSELTPVKKSAEIALPNGFVFQGLEAVDHYLVVFADGKAYYKDLLVSGNFIEISGFQLDATVEKLYSVLVPQSFRNSIRTSTAPSSTVVLKSSTSGSPGCMIVQDGLNQPRLISSDSSTRVIQTYSEWTIINDNREYVPVGKQMLWSGNILFIVAPDNKSIYRSVTGRPLDFVVAIDNNGEKLLDATGTSHSVNYNDITALIPVSGNGEVAIAVSSLNNTTLMISDGTTEFYGEPQFSNPSLFNTGAINESSYSEVLSDTVFIDQNGLKSFNAVRQQKVASNSNVFSKRVSSYFVGVTQDITAVGSYQNYELFAVKTIYGYGVLVFDSDLNTFVSFDQYEGVGAIKKFVTTRVNGAYRLFFLTVDNRLFEAYAGEGYETATFYGKELTTDDVSTLITPQYVYAQVEYTPNTGTIHADVLVDKVAIALYGVDIEATPLPSAYPLQDTGDQISEPAVWLAPSSRGGFSVGARLSWNTGSPISNILLTGFTTSYNVPPTTRIG